MKHFSGASLIRFSVTRPRRIAWIVAVATALLLTLAVLPSLWPATFSFLYPVVIDTDPENMLPRDDPARVVHNALKREFTQRDIVVVGVVNDSDPEGVFNVDSLTRIYELTQFARSLKWPDPDDPSRQVGIVEHELIAPSTVDNIEQGGLGAVRFDWLMPKPPSSREEALAVRERAQRIPFLNDTMVSGDGKAIALYLPLTSKDLSFRVRNELLHKIATWPESGDRFHITGLAVAEDTFGVEMFYQMAISAPLAMLVIFVLMWLFFRKLALIVSPMIVAMVSALSTMALLVITGNTIHIMSSMIPIFIMPIAVLDAVHILSEFFDRYQETRDRRRTVLAVMETLFTPMLFTTLTTAAAFASLALTPIPPVQVFGLFVAAGVFIAWLCTITFVPAFVMFIPERSLEHFGHTAGHEAEEASPLSRLLLRLGRIVVRRRVLILGATAISVVVAGFGISRISINDNPVRWFTPSHPIRVADRVLNEHFGGTYMAYLALEPGGTESLSAYTDGLLQRLETRRQDALDLGILDAGPVFDALRGQLAGPAMRAESKNALLTALTGWTDQRAAAASDGQFEAWNEAQLFLDAERQRDELFKQPEALRYVGELQAFLKTTGVVGKSNSVTDIVKTVHRELLLGEEQAFRIPDSANAVAQTLITFQSSHRPGDLWHFVTPDFRKTSIWMQLTSGDNRDMAKVIQEVNAYIAANPPPLRLTHRWYGLTYLNVVWQEKMVSGMAQAFLGSFLVVLLMMILLFRSALWGLLSMIPLTVTVGLIYGLIGFIGKDYDMPVAVLSALALGLAVDYAIHFLVRTRAAWAQLGSWQAAEGVVFGEPARAIARNAIILGAGFLPLLLAPLMPYKTVGVFIAAILLAAGLATLLILPALVTVLEPWLFGGPQAEARLSCRGGTCAAAAGTLAALVAVSVYQFFPVGAATLAAYGTPAAVAVAGLSFLIARRRACRSEQTQQQTLRP